MKRRRIGVTGAALLLVVVLTLGAALKLKPLTLHFDTVLISFERQQQAATSPGALLDQALLDSLDNLTYIRSFDHVFKRGSRVAEIRRDLWMDRCEVRQGDFYKFNNWLPFQPQRARQVAAPDQPPNWRHYSSSRAHLISGQLDAPANSVTWFDAYAYCQAVGGRLPSADEWISAASGKQSRLYPWGDSFHADAWPYLDPLLNAAQKCGVHADANTPAGVADMGHNVSEWSATRAGAYAAIMGGNAYNAPRALYGIAILHRYAPPGLRSPYLGFRCVYDNPPANTPWHTPPDVVALPAGAYTTGLPEDALLPALIAHLPSEQLSLIRQMLGDDARAEAADFYMTDNEITRRQYAVFLRDIFVVAGLYAEQHQPAEHRYQPPDWAVQMQRPDLPVTNVDWWSAHAFAAWAGGRLPTAEEWAFAASGGGRNVYPWGNQFIADATIVGERRATAPQAAIADNADRTAAGVFNMGGNVSEWTRSVSGAGGAYSIITKGGNYLLPGAATARIDFSNHVSPNYRSPTLGFRLVFDRPR